MLNIDYTAAIAPPNTLCAECGCMSGGDVMILTMEHDAILDRELPTYRHVNATGCLIARARSEAFWYHLAKEKQASL